MSPLDEELRAALRSRATVVPPSPDPLAGIERRAARIRRNRVAASVAASALAVAAIALAAPAVQGALAPRPDVPTVASAPPTLVQTPAPSPSGDALDPERPWVFRGTPVEEGTRAALQRELATRTGAAEVLVTPLFAQVHEPSQQLDVVYVAQVDGAPRWGVARSTEAGPEFLVDEALPDPALALAAALPGDEVPRLLVVASPESGAIEYFVDDTVEDATRLTGLADGVATGPLEGDQVTDSLLVREPDGRELWRGPAPDLAQESRDAPAPAPPSSDEEPPPGDEVPAPTDVVDWPVRGERPGELEEQAVHAFADAAGVSRDEVGTRLLFAGERDDRVVVLLQGWYGGDARAFAWAFDTTDGTADSVLMDPTAPGPALLTAQLDDLLLVVPEPAAGQVLYAPEAAGEPQPVADQGTEAAVLIDREPGTTGDRLLVLDGDGDHDRPLFRGTVDEALAASR
jgi:hypothetical protein